MSRSRNSRKGSKHVQGCSGCSACDSNLLERQAAQADFSLHEFENESLEDELERDYKFSVEIDEAMHCHTHGPCPKCREKECQS